MTFKDNELWRALHVTTVYDAAPGVRGYYYSRTTIEIMINKPNESRSALRVAMLHDALITSASTKVASILRVP